MGRRQTFTQAEVTRPFKPADLRRAVTEWAERGFSVRIEADGAITVTPQPVRPRDDFDLVDMRK